LLWIKLDSSALLLFISLFFLYSSINVGSIFIDLLFTALEDSDGLLLLLRMLKFLLVIFLRLESKSCLLGLIVTPFFTLILLGYKCFFFSRWKSSLLPITERHTGFPKSSYLILRYFYTFGLKDSPAGTSKLSISFSRFLLVCLLFIFLTAFTASIINSCAPRFFPSLGNLLQGSCSVFFCYNDSKDS
jgi:hypothetical protein